MFGAIIVPVQTPPPATTVTMDCAMPLLGAETSTNFGNRT
jgi:hypothetical protein